MYYLYSNKILNIAAILLCIYIAYTTCGTRSRGGEGYKVHQATGKEKGTTARVTMTLDPNKKYEEYTFTEKMVYRLFKSDIEQAKKNNTP